MALRVDSNDMALETLHQIVDVIKASYSVSGDLDRAIHWIANETLHEFGSITPLQLIAQNKTKVLMDHLASIESGFVG